VTAVLRDRLTTLPPEVQIITRAVIAAEGDVLRRFAALLGRRIVATRIRNHGDLELEQVLMVFGLEKCLDEIEREIDRKPGWLRIPLRGILEVVRME
jgi:predicted trehalose synthase